jgi:hypothetical protein
VFPTHNWRLLACSCGDAACSSPGKHPRTRRGVHDAEYGDADRIKAWWTSWPDANIGLATGTPSGLYVIDLDGDQGVEEWWALSLEKGGVEQTMSTRTGGGGIHLFYRQPAGMSLPNTAKRLAPHIDTRGTGGYVLVPPSDHRSGREYEWIREQSAADLPLWVMAMISAPERYEAPRVPLLNATTDDELALRILGEEAASVRGAPEGARNDTLNRATWNVATLAWAGELSMETVAVQMLGAAADAGLGEHEAGQTVASAIRSAKAQPRRLKGAHR